MTTDISSYEIEAEKFQPTGENTCGALLKVKQEIEYVMKLKDISQIKFDEGDTCVVLYDFAHEETGERALILLVGEERYMYMTMNFDDDFEVLRKGTTEMLWSKEDREQPSKITSDVAEDPETEKE